ncbi:MAG: NINE protein [Chloroflexota bacterium]|nr:NINE protein [Chloroflexota bacterium]MDE2960892.1 NINE protein [Chloroflexota bacterium]
MFSSGPKSRTTTALLAIFLGWAGIHKFYLGHRNVGAIHAALTGVGLLALLAPFFASASNLVAINIVAWTAILIGYFYVRRVHFGHTTAEILNPGRLLLWPWRLIRHTFRVVGFGANMMEREEEERDWRRYQRWRRCGGRGRRGRRDDNDDDDNGGCFSPGCIVLVLGILLTLAVVALIIFLYYVVFTFIGIIAFVASIAIGVTEGILYFRKSDSAFQNEYVVNRRPWF